MHERACRRCGALFSAPPVSNGPGRPLQPSPARLCPNCRRASQLKAAARAREAYKDYVFSGPRCRRCGLRAGPKRLVVSLNEDGLCRFCEGERKSR